MSVSSPQTLIRFVSADDEAFWFSLDDHMPRYEFLRKVRDMRGLILEIDGKPAGLLRYNLFWDCIPFCTLLYIKPEYQAEGYGKQLMQYWESTMQSRGYNTMLVSTQVNEDAQYFYRKLGYRDCGTLTLRPDDPVELFLVKSR